MNRLFILPALLAIIAYIKCDGETCLSKTGTGLTEDICKALTPSAANKECHVNDEGNACVEKDVEQTGGTGNTGKDNTEKDNTGTGKSDKEKTESSKSSSSSSMIKISLFLLISLLII